MSNKRVYSPTKRQNEFALSIAEHLGEALPDLALKDKAYCSEYISNRQSKFYNEPAVEPNQDVDFEIPTEALLISRGDATHSYHAILLTFLIYFL